MQSIVEQYKAATPRSSELAGRAAAVMPGGDTRAIGYFKPYPLTLVRGEGASVWDVDRRRYIDLLGNFTSLVHGHAYPPIVAEIARLLPDGTVWPARNF